MGGMDALVVDVEPVYHAQPLWKYYKGCDARYLEALQYRKAGNIHEEYRELFKYASLVLDTIPKHKDFQTFLKRQEGYRNFVKLRILPRLEELKPLIKAQPPVAHARRANVTQMGFANLPQVDWVHSQPEPQAALQHSLPPNYLEQNATVERSYTNAAASTSQASNATDPFAASIAFGALSISSPAPNGNLAIVTATPLPDWATSGTTFTSVKREFMDKHSLYPVQNDSTAIAPSSRQASLYPTFDLPAVGVDLLGDPPRVLPLPPQEMEVKNQVVYDVVEPPPGAVCNHADHTHAPAVEPVKVEKKFELRDVYIAPPVMAAFLQHAINNTRLGIESCGILAGTLSTDSSSFTVSTLIIPKQKGEANTVEMLNEEEIFDYQFERGLMPLGWIHTHPTQTCFLSSVDVHTQCGYQVMLSEAVAIVMAPTDPRQKCGIFRLTTPGGMEVVQSCQMRGFHQHKAPATGQEIYELCGHVFLDETAKFEVIDLR